MRFNPKKNGRRARRDSRRRGFTFIEVLVGIAVFLVISVATYEAYESVMHVVSLSRYRFAAADLANEQFEIARNMPYSDIGIVSGIPAGKLEHLQTFVRDNATFEVTTTVRNIDQPFDGIFGGTPNDFSPADNKLVEVSVACALCKNYSTMVFSALIAPKNLEQLSSNGALFVQVFDASGVSVSSVSVHIENNATTTPIIVDDVTNAQGMLQLVDVPPGNSAYEVTVTKNGYSTERTYPVTVENPNPSKPHATVAAGAVTQLSFAIDSLSTVAFSSVTDTCVSVGDFDFQMTGSKLLGMDPNVLKYDVAHETNAGGTLSLNAVEWDMYTLSGIDASYDLIGLNPLNPMTVNPGSTLHAQLIVAPKDPNRLLVTVKDTITLLPITEVNVSIQEGAFTDQKITGRGYLGQTDWSGGAGQALFSDPTRYAATDGNIDTDQPAGVLKLHHWLAGDYDANGWLESSTFDTGSESRFYSIVWTPLSQPPDTGADSVRFQAAANVDNETWDYTGPDGTSGSFYTDANQNLSSSLNDLRYFRYKAFLSTASSTLTPTVADLNFTFNSLCTPAGQVVFGGLSDATYHLTITKSGYQTVELDVPVTMNWQEQEVLLVAE